MLEGVLIDKLVELGFDLAGHCGRSAATGAVKKAAGAFLSKALHPFSQGRIGEMEGARDGFDGLSSDDLTDGLSAAKRLLGELSAQCCIESDSDGQRGNRRGTRE